MIIGKDKQKVNSLQSSLRVMSDIIINKIPQLEKRLTKLEHDLYLNNNLSLSSFQNEYGLSDDELIKLFNISKVQLTIWKSSVPKIHIQEALLIISEYKKNHEMYLNHIIKG